MPVDEESIYTITGEEINRTSIIEEMINFFSLLKEVGDTEITDFNEGSEIRNILETISVSVYLILEYLNDISLVAFLETAEGEYLDRHGNNPWIKQPRDTGTEATGYVTFKIPEAVTEDIVIPEETTVVCEETGNDYYTENETIIAVGDTEATASIICVTEGEDGNVGIGKINMIDDDYLDIPSLTVYNEEPITGGTNYEEDEEYRERLLDFVRRDDFGSFDYYIDLGNNVDGVHDICLLDTNQTDTSGKKYTKQILVNGDVKETPGSVLLDVMEVFSITGNIIAGHTFIVEKPVYVDVDLTVNLTVSETIDETELSSIIHNLFDGGETSYDGESVYGFAFEGLHIGETLFASSLTSTIELYDNVESVTVINNDTQQELTDLSVEENEVLNLVNLTINQTISE